MDGGYQVNEKGEYVECEDKRDGPFQHCGCVVSFLEVAGSEGDGEYDFDYYEDELDPEGDAEDPVLSEVCLQLGYVRMRGKYIRTDPKTLVLPANEYRGDDIAGDEEEKEDIVKRGVAEGIKDGEQDWMMG